MSVERSVARETAFGKDNSVSGTSAALDSSRRWEFH